MKTSLKKGARSQIGGNLRRRNLDALLAHRIKIRADQTRVQQRQAREFHRQCKKLFSKADLRIAAGIVDRIKKEFELASFNAGRDVTKRDAIKVAAQKKINQFLAKALPSFRKFQALKKAHVLQHAEQVEASLAPDRLTVHWGDMIVEDPEGIQDFVAPFQIFDSHLDDPDSLTRQDDSFANVTYSQVVNNIVFNDDRDTPFNPWFISLNRVKSASSFASCGINFTMPKTGRLQLGALLDNFANRVSFSIRDNFGFSSGNLDVRLLLFISVIRGGQVTHLTRTMLSKGLVSHGSDLNYTMPMLMNAAPYLVNGSTDETFSASESVQILAGSEVQVDSKLDDMESSVNALMFWRLKKISVAVI